MTTEHATFLGMPPFPVAARAALADTQLRRNLAHATGTIRAKRAGVVAEVDDWEELRQRAAATKDATLAHLDEHLLTLEAALTARGATVHWARDAADACAVVADVAKAHGIREVVKVKSMATQEIELNEALAAQGISAWETDLAELIVQLGDDLPSHILVPAIHRNRSEIRDIFRDRMSGAGKPAPEGLTDDPAALASAARLHLREKFLASRMAVSGANFAVAETGTLVVVESEGNGRMCLTLPDVLVTVVGIEKLVPTWADLDVFLRLLPRSSTGERMNPYTSTWSGVTPGDGPQEVHVVLLDNGRTRALADEVGRQALRCIRCSACLNACPVYERVGGHAYGSVYPGRSVPSSTRCSRGSGTTPRSTRCPTPRRCAGRAPTSARSPSTSPASWSTCAPRSSTPTGTTRCPRPRRWRCGPPPGAWRMPAGWAGASASPAWPVASAHAGGCRVVAERCRGSRGPGRAGPRPATCRCRPPSRSAPGGAASAAPRVSDERPRRRARRRAGRARAGA